jgi:hypothetical protein
MQLQVLIEKLILAEVFTAFREPEIQLPRSQDPTTGPCT